jgi:branched-chain amino acid transport system permease protein
MQTQSSRLDTLRMWAKQPQIALILVVVYIMFCAAVLMLLNPSDVWFPTWSLVFFPLLALSPLVILGVPLSRPLKIALMLFVLLVIVPIVGIRNATYTDLMISICISAGLALGLNIVVGFAGLLDLGYIAFFAIGAYVWGVFTSNSDTIIATSGALVQDQSLFYVFIFFGVLLAAVFGILLGLPVLRLRGDYLAIVTLGFGEMIRRLAENFDNLGKNAAGVTIDLTNGSQGLFGIAGPPIPSFWVDATRSVALVLNGRADGANAGARLLLFYLIGIATIGIIILVAQRLDNSAIGRAWTAIREDEVAAIAMGVPLVRMKLLAFAMGAAFAGAMGVLYAAKYTFIDPDKFSLIESITILAMVIIGGLGGIRGVVLGAIIVTLLEQLVLKNFSLQITNLANAGVPLFANWPPALQPVNYQPLLFGLILVLMMIYRPAGLLPEARRKLELQRREEDIPTDTAPAPIGAAD